MEAEGARVQSPRPRLETLWPQRGSAVWDTVSGPGRQRTLESGAVGASEWFGQT